MKKIIILVMILIVAFSSVAMASNQREIKVYVNSELVVFPDQQPIVDRNGRTLVPVRFPAEKFGAEVEWEQKEQKVDITHNLKNKDIKLWIGKSEYTVNGTSKKMDTEATLIGGRTMIPLRFVAEALDVVVDWRQTKGKGLVFNFTEGQSEVEMEKIMNEIVEKEMGEILGEFTSGIKYEIEQKGKDNPQNLKFSISADIDKDINAQYKDIRTILENEFGKDKRVDEIISHMKKKTERGELLEVKNWAINGQKVIVNGVGWVSTVMVWEAN